MCLTQDRYEYIKKMKNKQEDELKKPLGFTLNNKPLYKKDAEEIMKNKQKETLEEHDKHCGCGDSHTHKQEDDLKKEIESKRKLIDYYKNKVKELEIKLYETETYLRGYKDAVYYLGGSR